MRGSNLTVTRITLTTWAEAQAWVKANQDNLPTTYDDLVSHPLAYRRAIYNASAPEVRGKFWEEQWTRYRNTHPTMTDDQKNVLNRFFDLAGAAFATLTDADELAAVKAEDIEGILRLARRERPDLIVVGPEVPLCDGLWTRSIRN